MLVGSVCRGTGLGIGADAEANGGQAAFRDFRAVSNIGEEVHTVVLMAVETHSGQVFNVVPVEALIEGTKDTILAFVDPAIRLRTAHQRTKAQRLVTGPLVDRSYLFGR